MPGTILVSVLEFLGLPFSSSPSTISIKVSMGKKEYQTWEKGEFSFPLTTLRETLVVVVQDEEGNEISYAGVDTKSIVEKGLWDDIFPLEGGGKVHMKLQFVLNEDEKNRVRVVRESAMKKKQTSLERGSSFASSLYCDNADKNEESPSSVVSLPQRVDFNTSQVNLGEPVEKVEAQTLSADTPTKAVFSKESSSSIRSSELLYSSKKLSSMEEKESPSLAVTLPQKANVDTSQVNLREPIENIEAQSVSADTPTKAVFSKESSSSIRSSGLLYSSKKRASMEDKESPLSAITLPRRADFNTSQVNLSKPVEEVEAQSLFDDTPTKAVFSKESLSSIRSSKLGSSSKKLASMEEKESPSLAVTLPQKANVNTSQVNLREPFENIEAQPVSAETPTKAVFSKESSSSITSPESGSFLKRKASTENEESSSPAIPLVQRADSNTSQVSRKESVEKVEVRSLSDPPTKVIYPKQSSSSIRSSESGSSSKKRPSMERTPSSVKRMISAFESNLSQDIRPQVKPTPERREANKMRQEFGTQASGKFAELSTSKVIGNGTDITPNNKLKLTQKEPDKDKPDEDLMRKPRIGTSLDADKRLYELKQRSSNDFSSDKGDNADNVQETRAENSLKSQQSSTTPRTSTRKSTTMDDLEDLHEISGSWIFPDHHRRFCLTTGGKKVTDFLEGQSVTMSFSVSQKDNDDGDKQSETKRSKKAFKSGKSQPESDNVESSRGLIEQVIKVAIMVGFGFLVLFTRQRKNR